VTLVPGWKFFSLPFIKERKDAEEETDKTNAKKYRVNRTFYQFHQTGKSQETATCNKEQISPGKLPHFFFFPLFFHWIFFESNAKMLSSIELPIFVFQL
jgi:hypothetical protein